MPPEQPPQQKNSDALKRIRTYQSDVEEMMRRQPVSKAEIAIAESKERIKREVQPPQSPPSPFVNQGKVFPVPNNLPLVPQWNMRLLAMVAVAILVVGGIGVGAFFFFRQTKPPVIAEPKREAPQSVAIVLEEGESRAGTIKKIWDGVRVLSVPQNELRAIPIKIGATEATTEELFLRLETSAPASLIRALGTTPTIGVHGFKGGQPFLLWNVSSFNFAFAGMLEWEQNLLYDIGPLFGISPREMEGKASSTTDEILANTIVIKDVILRNKDARAAFDPQGKIIFLYSFLDKQTLVLTTNEDTLKILMSKAGGGRLR